MNAKKNKNDVIVRIVEIKEISFSNKLNDEIINNFSEKEIGLTLAFKFNYLSDKDLLSISFSVVFKHLSLDIEFIHLETDTIFDIINYTDKEFKFDKENKIIDIDDRLTTFLLSQTIGSTRGMLAYKMASLPINLVLPIIDPKEIMSESDNIITEEKK
ncbi:MULTISPECIES: hypothetical protein [unclassified Tenacibaculum]|uniref:hypothetical protein n=1 Tax=unclassified Tenacibaculum TaxID=2635139 RepID=UPI001F3244D1|nr:MULTISPECIES: hypothetical protein [unclassified Tenacibaculum]MCF2875448.1 hypothetical protein [Tenacibaculum sp. Cn5-1]MCF2935524.1 hypothetical protein [Tenacibaculum sp. Cn5-34]MCG7512084.1 hypothetical protein [Tenacibaculum sp. Cn5-46]